MPSPATDISPIQLPITTRRLIIRDYTEQDGAAVAAYVAVESYWEHQAVDIPAAEQIKALVTWAAAETNIKPRINYFLAATKKDTGEIIGEAVLRAINPAMGQVEIGFGIAGRYWRQGYATEIGHALLDMAFSKLKANRVAAQSAPENKGSIRVMQKLGMAREGLMRDVGHARGRWWSTAVYSILDTEYAKIRAIQRG